MELVDEVKHEKMGDGEQKNLPVVSPNHSGETLQDAGRVQREQLSRILDVTDHAKSIDFASGADVSIVHTISSSGKQMFKASPFQFRSRLAL